MLESLKTPWWRLPVTLLGVGLLVLAIDIVAGLGWIPYLIAVIFLMVGLTLLTKAEVDGGPRVLIAYCAGSLVLIAGLGFLHPDSWQEPGHTGPGNGAKLLGRVGSRGIFVNKNLYSSWSLESGKIVWQRRYNVPVVLVGDHLLVQEKDDPTKAKAFIASNHSLDGIVPWRAATPVVKVAPTAAQKARMPDLSSGEKVIAAVNTAKDYVRLVAAKDFTGHHFTRLDVVADNTLTQYSVHDATGLQLVKQVLLIDGPNPRVLPIVR